MAEKTTINSSELLKNCYGTQRQQKKGSCWFDSTLEIMLNADLIGEIVRANVFEYGLYKDKVVPYRVKSELIKSKSGQPKIQFFILYMILNYILFNMEITNNTDFIVFEGDSYEIKRKEELEVCERNLEIFLAKIRKILVALKVGESPKISLAENLTENSYGGMQILIYELFFNNIKDLQNFINVNIYYGRITKSKKEEERKRIFPKTSTLFNRNNFLAASLSFKEHATSVMRCQNTIFYYDNNAPIDTLTKKRTIDFSIQKDEATGTVVKRDDFLEKFWTNGLNYLKHWGDYFDRYKHDGYNFKYIQKVGIDSNDFYENVTIFEKKEDRSKYSKVIPLIKLDDSINLKDILSCEFFKNKSNIVSLFSSDEEINKFINDCYTLFVSQMHISNKYLYEDTNQELQFYQKYKKYKVKYLNLLTKINSKKLIL